MKLGEALTVRRRQAERLNDLRGRIKANAMVQEGDQPQENVDALLAEFKALSETHGQLVQRINRTNVSTSVSESDDVTLLDLLASREHFNRWRNMLGTVADAATPSRNDYRFMRTEVRFVPTIDIAATRAEKDDVQAIIENLDSQIQEVNWQTELL